MKTNHLTYNEMISSKFLVMWLSVEYSKKKNNLSQITLCFKVESIETKISYK